MNKMFLGEGEKKVHKFLKFSQTISLAPHIQKKSLFVDTRNSDSCSHAYKAGSLWATLPFYPPFDTGKSPKHTVLARHLH
jgi:hypothetical protein